MNTSDYEHSDKHLDRDIAQEIIKDKLEGTGNIEMIGEMVLEHHLNNGGLLPDPNENFRFRDLYTIINTAMLRLCREGYAERKSRDKWTLHAAPLRVFGEGEASVYLFYDPRDKSAESWACNIGCTERNVEVRVKEQTKQWTVSPAIALIFKTDAPEDLEDKLHHILERVGRWRKDIKDKRAGREWFDTDPDEVCMLYQHIQLCDQRDYNIYELYS